MHAEFLSSRPELNLTNAIQKQEIWRQGLLLIGQLDAKSISTVSNIISTAKKIGPRVCGLNENDDTNGFMIGITRREPDYPILTLQIGTINKADSLYGSDGKRGKYSEFIQLKGKVLQENPNKICSSENLLVPEVAKIKSSTGIEIPGGAISTPNRWVIITSGFKNPQMDTAVSLAMAVGAGIIGSDQAEVMAHDSRLNCLEQYMKHIESILEEEVLH